MDKIALSKTMAYALRHDPDAYGLILDESGWVSVNALLVALTGRFPGVTAADLQSVVTESTQQRYEIDAGRIRAGYGHSTDSRIEQTPDMPPEVLFHGTPAKTADAIEEEGLRSMGRQYVHLSSTPEIALTVGARNGKAPVIFAIDATAAHNDGIVFYSTTDPNTWLVESVPPTYLARTQFGSV